MVRIKHRYLLFNILYPTLPAPTSSSSSSSPAPYLLFAGPSPAHLTSQLLLSTLRASIQSLFGDHGVSVTQSALRVVYFSPTTSTAIVRVPRAHFRLVWASLTLMSAFPAPPPAQRGEAAGEKVRCVVRVVRVSGTIRKSEEEVLRRARRDIVRAKRSGLGLDGEEDVLEGLLRDNSKDPDTARGNGKGKGKAREYPALQAQQDRLHAVEESDPEDDMDDLSD